MRTFTIIIATCDRPDLLLNLLCVVKRMVLESGGDHKVLVMDNGRNSPAKAVVDEFSGDACFPVFCHVSEYRNKAKALNKGIALAETEWLAFTDDDALPDESWLVEAARYVDEWEIDLFGGRIIPSGVREELPSWLRTDESWGLLRGPAVVSYEPLKQSGILDDRMPVPLGANFFAKKSIFEKYGGYDESLWSECGNAALGCEDAEFSMRIRAAGEAIGYASDVKVVHPVIASRSTVLHHLKWAWRTGVREGILFAVEERLFGNLRLLYVGACSALKCVGNLCVGRVAMAMKCAMSSVAAIGEWKYRALVARRCNLWESQFFVAICRWAQKRTLSSRMLGDFITWYYHDVSEKQLMHFYGGSYLEGYAENREEEKLIKKAQAQAICQVFPESRKLLVVGCSNGLLVKELVQNGKDVYGMDVSPNIFKHAVNGVEDRLRLGSITRIPFSEKDAYDVIVAIDVVEHVPAGLVAKMVSELYRIGSQYLVLVINHTALTCLGHVTMKPLDWWEDQFAPFFVRTSDKAINYDKVPRVYSLEKDGDPCFTFWQRK